jgi:hypothetical protein
VPGLAVLPGAQLRLLWREASGAGVSVTSSDTGRPLVAVVPDGKAFVTPLVRFADLGYRAIGPSLLRVGIHPAPVPPVAGEGCPAYSITGYTHSLVPGNGEYRDITLDLVEVSGAAR